VSREKESQYVELFELFHAGNVAFSTRSMTKVLEYFPSPFFDDKMDKNVLVCEEMPINTYSYSPRIWHGQNHYGGCHNQDDGKWPVSHRVWKSHTAL